MSKRTIWVAVCAAIGVSFALAGSSPAVTGQNSNSGTTMSGQGNMNGSGGRGATALSSGDRKFMMMAAQGGAAEIAMARLALERASSDEVRQYAQRMIDDHTRSGEELMAVAQQKGVALPAAPDSKHMAMMDKMRALSGAAFDREYIMMAGRKAHEKMEKLYRDESMKGRDADVRAFAAKTLPVVREHLMMARAMHGKMMGTGANMNSNGGSMNMNSNMNGNMNMNSNMNSNRGGNSNNSNNSNR